MKNISIQIAVAIVSLALVVASAFLMTAADAEIRVLARWRFFFCAQTVEKACHSEGAARPWESVSPRPQARNSPCLPLRGRCQNRMF